jgi:hypothetical protein
MKNLRTAIFLASALVACSAQVEGDDESADALGVAEQALAAVPIVRTRTISGSQIVIGFDRAVSASELPTAAMKVEVVRRSGTSMVKSNVLQGAALSADGRTLTMNLREAVQPGTAYYARGAWKRCRSILGRPLLCQTFPAEFGQLVVKSSAFAVLNGIAVARPTPVVFAPIARIDESAGIPQIQHVSAPSASVGFSAPAAGPGTLRLRSMTPIAESLENSRDLKSVTMDFEGGTLDCANLIVPETLRLYSRTPDIANNQLMFHDPAAPEPWNWGHRGSLRCLNDSGFNRLIFTTPGHLLGDAQYLLEVSVRSVEGDRLTFTRDFYTERPGLQVFAQRIENDYGGNDTCDSEGIFGRNDYCDLYLTLAIAAGSADDQKKVVRFPDQGNYENIRKFSEDPVRGAIQFAPERSIFATPKVGIALELDALAFDADDTSHWKKILGVLGTVATKVGATIAEQEPKAGAITAAVGAGLTTISEAIPEGEDDLMGNGGYRFTREDGRWGTQGGSVRTISISNGAPNRGPVRFQFRIEEYPRPWSMPSPIL